MLRAELRTLWTALRSFPERSPFRLAAALSYYTLFSLAPIVLVTVSIAGLLFGREAVEGRLVGEMRTLVGEPAAELVQLILRHASEPERNLASLALGLGTLLLGATTVFVQLQSAMNEIWRVETRPGRFVLSMLRKRLLSLGMILAVGFLLLVSLLLSTGLTALGDWAAERSGGRETVLALLRGLDLVLSIGVVGLLLALMFRFLPDVELAWGDVLSGARLTAALFTGGKFLIGLYLGRASVGSAYGAAGSVVVFLVWVYYAALILLFGAQLTRVRTERRGVRVRPEPHAKESEPDAG